MPAEPGVLSFRYVFAHGPNTSSDSLKAWIEDETGTRTVVFSKPGTWATVPAAWTRAVVPLTPFAGTSIRIVIQASDRASDNLVEVLVDDIRVERKP